MDCNRDDAIRSMEIAESKFKENNVVGAKKFALKAKALHERLEGIDHMIVALDVHLRAQEHIGGEKDWYGILEVARYADQETIKKQYKKLAFQTHPDKNKFIGADGAFKHIADAWSVLSDKNKKLVHDHKVYMGTLRMRQNISHANANTTPSSSTRSTNGFCSQSSVPAPPTNMTHHNGSIPSTFWTSCFSCGLRLQYPRECYRRYLTCSACKQVFLGLEVSSPSPTETTAFANGAMPGTGVASGSNQNDDPMLQRGSSHGAAAGAHTSTHSVQQTHGAVSGSSPGSTHETPTIPRNVAATKGKEAAKEVVMQSASSGLHGDSRKRKPSSATGTSEKKRSKVSSAECSRTKFKKVIMKLDVQKLVMERLKSQMQDKLEEFSRKRANDTKEKHMKPMSNSDHPKDTCGRKLASKRAVLEERERAQSSKYAGLGEKKSWEWKKPEVRFVYTRRHPMEQKTSSDEMAVPDADFNNFGAHPESSFQKGQVWATYDEEDGMPRYYAVIRKVRSTHPFKVGLAFLKADDCNEFGTSNWTSCGYSKTCGDFKHGTVKYIDQLNSFSHVVTWEKGPGETIRIFPKKGDIWALYQNWSPDWDEFTPDETMYKYELVEVLDNYRSSDGICVRPIVKVPGFVSVFKPLLGPTKSRRIPKAEMLRFSHQVPFHVLTGEEAQNSPKGFYELDPASTPHELLQVNPV